MEKTSFRNTIWNVCSLCLLLPVFFLVSCKDGLPDLGAGANLPDKRWVFTELKVSSLFTDDDFYADFEPCERDDFMEFRTGGLLILDEGPTKCDPNDPQQTEGTWRVEGNTLIITGIDLGLPITTFNIEITESTETTLRGTFKERVQGITFTGRLALQAL